MDDDDEACKKKNRYCDDNVNWEEKSPLGHRPIINKLHRTVKKERHNRTNCPSVMYDDDDDKYYVIRIE